MKIINHFNNIQMQITISENSKKAFEAAAFKLGLTNDLPDVSKLREDLGLWITANYMMAVIIEAGKDGKIYDTTDHSKFKYYPWHYAENGYIPGSGGGFSCDGCGCGDACTSVGARLTFNSSDEVIKNAETYPDLWEIIKLNVK